MLIYLKCLIFKIKFTGRLQSNPMTIIQDTRKMHYQYGKKI